MKYLPTRTSTFIATGVAACVFASTAALAQYPYQSKVDLRFDHWYDYEEMTQAMHDLADAYPDLLTLESIGKSVGGRDMWLMTVNNPKTGPDTSKAAMFIDGNIHGNEIQAAETVLYSIWYLTKSYGKIDKITELVDQRSFYFLPMENPDGRHVWFHEPATPHYLRGGIRPIDNDHDGAFDEDGYDDLDGDGHITQMYKQDPKGRYKLDEKDPRFMKRVEVDDEPGGWTRAGSEGIDNDGDGSINEDGLGGYDPNRNWPSDWQPNYIQGGSGDFPFSLPETRAIADFLYGHPNVAAFQSYHNAGGMILRGPGAKYVNYPSSDIRVYDKLQEAGAKILPFYRKMAIYPDLYTVHGGEVNWAYEGLGITAFTNELWTDKRMYMKDDGPSSEERKEFADWVQFGDVYVPYKEYDHPTLGKVLIGGTKKYSSRITPPWALEEGCHRNFAFTMFHAKEMPIVEWGMLQVRSLGGDLWEITIEVKNDKIIPSITAMAQRKKIGKRDVIECQTGDMANVVASGTASGFRADTKLRAVKQNPERLWNDAGIGGKSSRLFRFIVEGSGDVQLEYRSEKGGNLKLTIPLAECEAGAAVEEDEK